jgi:hypothetical protein
MRESSEATAASIVLIEAMDKLALEAGTMSERPTTKTR